MRRVLPRARARERVLTISARRCAMASMQLVISPMSTNTHRALNFAPQRHMSAQWSAHETRVALHLQITADTSHVRLHEWQSRRMA